MPPAICRDGVFVITWASRYDKGSMDRHFPRIFKEIQSLKLQLFRKMCENPTENIDQLPFVVSSCTYVVATIFVEVHQQPSLRACTHVCMRLARDVTSFSFLILSSS